MADSDEMLLSRSRAGDLKALGEMFLRHGPGIGRNLDINPKWRSVLEANDILQVTYFEAFEQINRFNGDAPTFPHWLRRIAENNLRDAIQALEREKRPQPDRRLTSSDEEAGAAQLYDMVAGGATTPSGHASGNELRKLLETEIDSLPHDYAHVLRSIYFEGRSIGSIAEGMSRTRGAIHLLRHRAVARLRERLGSGSAFMSFH